MGLFNKLMFAQPERTNFGIRNIFFYFQQQKQQENDEKGKQQVSLIKNKNAHQLILVPISTDEDNNDFEWIQEFAEQADDFLKKNQTKAIYKDIKLLFTLQPGKYERIEKQIMNSIRYINKLMNKTGAEHVSCSFV